MVGPFQAGAVNIAFQADIRNLQAGLKSVEQSMNRLGATVTNVANKTATASTKTTAAMTDVSKQATVMTTRIGNAAVRLLSLQVIISQFGSRAGTGKFGREVAALADGFTVFVTTLTVLPTPIGIAIGAIGGLATAMISLGKESEKTRQFLEQLGKELEGTTGALDRELDLILRTAVGTKTLADEVSSNVSALREQLGIIARSRKAIAELEKAFSDGTIDFLEYRKQLFKVFETTNEAEKAFRKLLEVNIELNKSIAEQNLSQPLDDVVVNVARVAAQLQIGLLTPLEAAEAEIQAIRTAMTAVADEAGRIAAEGNIKEFQTQITNAAKVLDDLLEDAQEALTSAQVDAALDEAIKSAAEIDIDEINRRIQASARTQRSTEFAEAFSVPIGQAVGDAVFQGILNGAEAMEILADVGQNLFANFLDQSIQGFQKGMIQAFDAIAGQGGAVLGQALSAAVGIAGFFLSKQGRGDSSAAFAGVQSAIDSSQAVRGVVAGPTSVAIAAVGEDLRRAMEPVREIMAMSLVELRKIAANTSGGPGGGGGGAAFAGAVATT